MVSSPVLKSTNCALEFSTFRPLSVALRTTPVRPAFLKLDVRGEILEIRPAVGVMQAHARDREADAKFALAVTERKTPRRTVEDELSRRRASRQRRSVEPREHSFRQLVDGQVAPCLGEDRVPKAAVDLQNRRARIARQQQVEVCLGVGVCIAHGEVTR